MTSEEYRLAFGRYPLNKLSTFHYSLLSFNSRKASLERVMGIEPTSLGRKHSILPLNYTRKSSGMYFDCRGRRATAYCDCNKLTTAIFNSRQHTLRPMQNITIAYLCIGALNVQLKK